jgi:hypothetical protein
VTDHRATDPRVPWASRVFGFGPMLPLVAAALGAWTMSERWGQLAVHLSIIWAALILSFIGGVRRGFGFGQDRASTPVEVATAAAYLILAGLALVVPYWITSLSLLIVGYALAALLDWRAARRGDAPAHFARLRPPQLLIGVAALVALWAWLLA